MRVEAHFYQVPGVSISSTLHLCRNGNVLSITFDIRYSWRSTSGVSPIDIPLYSTKMLESTIGAYPPFSSTLQRIHRSPPRNHRSRDQDWNATATACTFVREEVRESTGNRRPFFALPAFNSTSAARFRREAV
jgi:hypothetical protein